MHYTFTQLFQKIKPNYYYLNYFDDLGDRKQTIFEGDDQCYSQFFLVVLLGFCNRFQYENIVVPQSLICKLCKNSIATYSILCGVQLVSKRRLREQVGMFSNNFIRTLALAPYQLYPVPFLFLIQLCFKFSIIYNISFLSLIAILQIFKNVVTI